MREGWGFASPIRSPCAAGRQVAAWEGPRGASAVEAAAERRSARVACPPHAAGRREWLGDGRQGKDRTAGQEGCRRPAGCAEDLGSRSHGRGREPVGPAVPLRRRHGRQRRCRRWWRPVLLRFLREGVPVSLRAGLRPGAPTDRPALRLRSRCRRSRRARARRRIRAGPERRRLSGARHDAHESLLLPPTAHRL
jgi:hypothetical protein